MKEERKNTERVANELLLEKYEPILVIKLMRIHSMEELNHFITKIQEDFGYNTLVLPGELETSVEVVSVCNAEIKDINELKENVNNLIKSLEQESKEPVTFKTAKEITDGEEN